MRQEPEVMIFDNFFHDPDSIRAEVLKRDFGTGGSNFPSQKAEPETPEYQEVIKKHIEDRILGRPISYWEKSYNTCWQYSIEGQKQPVHHDHGKYVAIVYLTPNAPVAAGTGLYRHIESGISVWDQEDPATYPAALNTGADEDTWEQVAFFGNVYNRLIIFNAQHYHKGAGTFGTNKEDGRLYCTYFFS